MVEVGGNSSQCPLELWLLKTEWDAAYFCNYNAPPRHILGKIIEVDLPFPVKTQLKLWSLLQGGCTKQFS